MLIIIIYYNYHMVIEYLIKYYLFKVIIYIDEVYSFLFLTIIYIHYYTYLIIIYYYLIINLYILFFIYFINLYYYYLKVKNIF